MIEPIVRASGVWRFVGERPLLRDIALDVAPGECVVVCGPSGSGKTTLLRTIAGLDPIQRGEIRVAGRLRNSPRGVSLGRGDVGMVFQGEQLYTHLTVLENITLAPRRVRGAPPRDAAHHAEALLDSVGLLDKAPSFPHELSGGQRQRVAIVRALAMDPALILLDEPTSALDPASASETLAVVDRVRELGQTVIMVTHEMGFARMSADRVVCMEDGFIREVDAPSQVMLQPHSDATRRLFGHALNDISVLDRVRHTKRLNVGWLDSAPPPASAAWLTELAGALDAVVAVKPMTCESIHLDVRMGSVDLVVGCDAAPGERACFDCGTVDEDGRQYCLYVSAVDPVWRRAIEATLARRLAWQAAAWRPLAGSDTAAACAGAG